MWLPESEIEPTVRRVQAAFPGFTGWEHVNEKDDCHMGFTVWGEFVLDAQDEWSQLFYVTMVHFEDKWRGHLTIGQHAFLWSSNNENDAYIVDTEPCGALEDVIADLKARVARISAAVVAS